MELQRVKFHRGLSDKANLSDFVILFEYPQSHLVVLVHDCFIHSGHDTKLVLILVSKFFLKGHLACFLIFRSY